MFRYQTTNFDLDQIADSGQCFRMLPVKHVPHAYTAVSGGHVLYVRKDGDEIEFSCPEDARAFWENYFDMQTDYAAMIASVDPEDSYLTEAAESGSGIRILRQDPWEMIITFIISQQKTIPAIRRLVEDLSRRYGTKLSCTAPDWAGGGKTDFFAFPTPEQLNRASLEELLDLKLGYRAKYIHAVCEDVCAGRLDFMRLASMGYDDAMDYLQGFYGIGKKVANCICLFGLHHIDAFPVDTWIRKILMSQYAPRYRGKKRGLSEDRLSDALIRKYFSRYQGYAGVMQQYIFYFARTSGRPR